MSNFDVSVVQGLATALSKMILLRTPTWKQISNLSLFFVPPRNSKTVSNTNFLKLHVMEQEGRGDDEKEVDQITAQVPQWSYKVTGIRKKNKNFAKLWSLLFGEDIVLARCLSSWDKHIFENEQCYDDYKSEHNHFIVFVLNKIYQNIQRHLVNCQQGWAFINWQDFNFDKIQRDIFTESFVVKKLSWVRENKQDLNYSIVMKEMAVILVNTHTKKIHQRNKKSIIVNLQYTTHTKNYHKQKKQISEFIKFAFNAYPKLASNANTENKSNTTG